MLARAIILLIRVYQWTLSPLMGNVCRFEPSCSRYTIECIRIHGAFTGIWLGFRRVLRCHPFNPGGYDPPPLRDPQASPDEASGSPSSSVESHRMQGLVPRAVNCPEVF